MSMLVDSYRFGSAPGAGYLDGLSPLPRAVHSLRKLISTATTAIRVRRSSDNAEQDIGFTGDALDTAALASFVGANSAYVTTFYDQTGNGYPKTQTTAANQPRIVNAGVYDGMLVYDGSDDAMVTPTLPFATSYVGLFLKAKLPQTGGTRVFYESSSNYTGGAGRFLIFEDSGQFNASFRTPIPSYWTRSYTYSPTGLDQVTLLLQTAVIDSTTAQQILYVGGSFVSSASSVGTAAGAGMTFAANPMYSGARAGTSLYSAIWEETSVLYDADTTSVRTSIEAIVA